MALKCAKLENVLAGVGLETEMQHRVQIKANAAGSSADAATSFLKRDAQSQVDLQRRR